MAMAELLLIVLLLIVFDTKEFSWYALNTYR